MRWWLVGMLAVACAACLGATTQPATRPSEVADLRRIIADLQRQVAGLKAENAKLATLAASLQARLPAPAAASSSAPSFRDIRVGMSAKDARAAMAAVRETYQCTEDEDAQVGDRIVHRERWESRYSFAGLPEIVYIEGDKVVRVKLGDHGS